MDGVTLLARCLEDQVVRGQIAARYPQAQIQEIPAEDDPLRLDEDDQAWSMTLRADGPEYVPPRTFRDDDLLDPGSDPLIALMGALSNLNEGERIVARLMLRSMGPDWSESHLEKAHKRPVEDRRDPSYTYQTRPLQTDGVTMAVLGVAALAALRGYLWVQAGETWKAVLMGAGVAFALAVGGWAWHCWKKARKRVFDPILIKEKVSRIAFDAEIQVTAVLPADTGQQRARELLGTVAAAYRGYDNPPGAAPVRPRLLRNMEHTAAVHGFMAGLSCQARDLGWETDQLDPPRRASRYFSYFGGMRSVHPDAFGILRREGVVWPFFLAWERRAVRPATMAHRLAPYLRYYSSHRPTDDHGAAPAVLVVFDDDIAQTHFLRVAREEMDRVRVAVPLLASHRGLLERRGPLGRAWLAPGGFEPVNPLPAA